MIVRPYEHGDLDRLSIQPAQIVEAADAKSQMAGFVDGGATFTGLRADGTVIGIAGLVAHHPGYATAWSLLAEVTPHELAAITQIARRVLDVASYRRIDLFIQPEFKAARQWAWLLGFAQERSMFAARPDGGDWMIFARFRRGDG